MSIFASSVYSALGIAWLASLWPTSWGGCYVSVSWSDERLDKCSRYDVWCVSACLSENGRGAAVRMSLQDRGDKAAATQECCHKGVAMGGWKYEAKTRCRCEVSNPPENQRGDDEENPEGRGLLVIFPMKGSENTLMNTNCVLRKCNPLTLSPIKPTPTTCVGVSKQREEAPQQPHHQQHAWTVDIQLSVVYLVLSSGKYLLGTQWVEAV